MCTLSIPNMYILYLYLSWDDKTKAYKLIEHVYRTLRITPSSYLHLISFI